MYIYISLLFKILRIINKYLEKTFGYLSYQLNIINIQFKIF